MNRIMHSIIASMLLITLAGCGTKGAVRAYLGTAKEAAVTVAVLSDAYHQSKLNYGHLKSAIQRQRSLFSEDAWKELTLIDAEFVAADGLISDLLERDSSIELRAIKVQQVVDIVRPLDRATQRAIGLLDPVITQFPDQDFSAYIDARGGYQTIKRKVNQLLENQDVVDRGGLLLEMVGIVGKVAGTAARIII